METRKDTLNLTAHGTASVRLPVPVRRALSMRWPRNSGGPHFGCGSMRSRGPYNPRTFPREMMNETCILGADASHADSRRDGGGAERNVNPGCSRDLGWPKLPRLRRLRQFAPVSSAPSGSGRVPHHGRSNSERGHREYRCRLGSARRNRPPGIQPPGEPSAIRQVHREGGHNGNSELDTRRTRASWLPSISRRAWLTSERECPSSFRAPFGGARSELARPPFAPLSTARAPDRPGLAH